MHQTECHPKVTDECIQQNDRPIQRQLFLELGYRNSLYLLRKLEDIKSIRIFVRSRHCMLADVADQGSGNIPHFLYVI